MATANEVLGEKTVELSNLHVEYTRLLLLLSQVVSGEIDADRVTVDLRNRSWSLSEERKNGFLPRDFLPTVPDTP